MHPTRVFLSFDADHDKDLKNGIEAQFRNEKFPLPIDNCSMPGPINHQWEKVAEEAIRKANVLLVICGPNVHNSEGVTKEVQMAQRHKRRIVLISAGKRGHSHPKGVSPEEPIHSASWASLSKVIPPTSE